MLEIKSVYKYYNSFPAAENISFSVEPGKVLGLLGPNGAGKTTLLRIILNILSPSSGSILYNGRNRDRRFSDITGYLPEERGLYKKSRVIDVLKYFGKLKGMNSDACISESMRLLDRMEISGYYNNKIDELSKGMQQKVQFIASIIHNPEIIILDEPFSGFDPVNRNFLKEFIDELTCQNKTIILSTHQLDIAAELCESIFLINHGREILSGRLADIKNSALPPVYNLLFSGNQNSLISFFSEYSSQFKLIDFRQSAEPKGLLTAKIGINPASIQNKKELNVVSSFLLEKLIQVVNVSEFFRSEPTLEEIFVSSVSLSKASVENEHNEK